MLLMMMQPTDDDIGDRGNNIIWHQLVILMMSYCHMPLHMTCCYPLLRLLLLTLLLPLLSNYCCIPHSCNYQCPLPWSLDAVSVTPRVSTRSTRCRTQVLASCEAADLSIFGREIVATCRNKNGPASRCGCHASETVREVLWRQWFRPLLDDKFRMPINLQSLSRMSSSPGAVTLPRSIGAVIHQWSFNDNGHRRSRISCTTGLPTDWGHPGWK